MTFGMAQSPSPDKPPIRRYRRLVGWDLIALASPGGMAVYAVPKAGGVAYLPGET